RPPRGRRYQVNQRDKGSPKSGRSAVETPRFTNTEESTHEHAARVEASDVDQPPFRDVLLMPQVGSSHPACLKGVYKGPFDDFASSPASSEGEIGARPGGRGLPLDRG